MGENLDYARMFAQFPFALRRFLKKRLTLDSAKKIVRDRMAQRSDNLLCMVERNIYSNPRSPYLKLLKHAGCELGDLRTLVQADGVEGALKKLRADGVYVTFEEFKGRKPIVRGGLHVAVTAADFDNPYANSDIPNQTGGSTGAAVKVAIDMDYIAARASNRMVALAAHNLLDAPLGMWRGGLPDRTMGQILYGALTNNLPLRWFSPNRLRDSRSWVKYGLGTYYLISCLRLAGAPVPFPEYVDSKDALLVARWAAETSQKYGRCLMRGGTSRGVRVCVAAAEAGLDMTGVTFMGAGEPATPGKASQYERVGARFISNYGMSEAEQPAAGCANPVTVSDYHLFTDACTLFTHPYHVERFGITVPAFNLTTILPVAPKVMFNVQTDDYGIVEERRCGCELESYGYTTHLRDIRSYSKLTGEGVTLIGEEIISILENVLPARFGGTPLDYQLMEQEDATNLTRLYLIISQRVEISDESAVIACFLDALRRGSSTADATRIVWQKANSIQIKRMEPIWSKYGKFVPLHLAERHSPNTTH